jgi:hypothetical protein
MIGAEEVEGVLSNGSWRFSGGVSTISSSAKSQDLSLA